VFKRATSLAGVESLIEHRRDSEGPSSPVPDDLLRLSIGIEGARRPDRRPGGRAGEGRAPVSDLAAEVTAALSRSILPSVIARGAVGLRVVAAEDGVVTLAADGSPGAVRPILRRIEAQIRAAVPRCHRRQARRGRPGAVRRC